jgi:adenylate cyclase
MPEETKVAPNPAGWKQALSKYWKKTPTVFKALASIVIALNAFFALYSRFAPTADVKPKETASVSSPGKSASIAKTSHPALPDKPSIAVLPFVNVSGDKEQDQFSDGLTDGIINAVSKLRSVLVISRNSTFTYKGKAVKAQQVAEEMGVQYVLEGSVQKTGEKVRVTAQLVDALSGREVMSERYDRNLTDIFALQDEITMHVLSAMRVALTEGEMARVTAKGTKSLDAYLKVIRAAELRSAYNPQNLAMGKRLAEEAIALDPKYAMAYSVIGTILSSQAFTGQYKDPKEVLAKARAYGEKAIALDDSLGYAHSALSWTLIMSRDYDRAISEAQRGLDLEPGSAQANHMLGICFSYSGQYEQSIPLLKNALRLSPVPNAMTLVQLAASYRLLGRYQESIAVSKELVQREPDQLGVHLGLATTYILVGREPEARVEAAEVIRISPNFSLEQFASSHPLKNRNDLQKLYIEPLREAGLK